MRASFTLKENIDALLHRDGANRKDLAFRCKRSESWISKIMGDAKREFPVKYLDPIADFFGLQAYQLLQPGISRASERRIGERRTGQDRRVAPVLRTAAELSRAVNPMQIQQGGHDRSVSQDAIPAPVAALLKRIETYYATHTGGKNPDAQAHQSKAPRRRRVSGG